MDLAVMTVIGGMSLVTTAAIVVGLATGKMEMRPFRTTAVVFAIALMSALYMALNHDLSLAGIVSEEANKIVNFVVDVSVVMVVLTGLVTALTKLSDDGGESDTIKAINLLVKNFGGKCCKDEAS